MSNSNRDQIGSEPAPADPVSRSPLDAIRERLERERERSKYDSLRGDEHSRQEIEIGAITWERERDDEKAFYALNQCGWDKARLKTKLTEEFAWKGGALIRVPPRNLVRQARVECVLQHDFTESESEAFRGQLRMASRCPFLRLK